MYKSPGLINCLLIYIHMNRENHPKENVHTFSDDKIRQIITDMVITTEEPAPRNEEDFYRLACRYVLDLEAFNNYQKEQEKEYNEIYR